MSDDEATAPGRHDELVAAALGLLALAIACVPPALFALTPDDGARGAWMFADAQKWIGLRWFALSSVIGVIPALLLARLSLDRARRWPAKVPAAVAIVAALPMIPGALMQVVWWTSR